MAYDIRLQPHALDPAAELRVFLSRLNDDGAIVSFVGITRGKDREGKVIRGLYLDHYPILTERSLRMIVSDASKKFKISDAIVVHRCGFVPAGEPIVFTATAAPHRRVAFLAADYLMDRLKTDAVLWKKEDGETGSRWIEPTNQDHNDRNRWFDDAAD